MESALHGEPIVILARLEQADREFFSDTPDNYVGVRPGEFVVFFPDDAHAPLIGTGEVHKVVIKVPM